MGLLLRGDRPECEGVRACRSRGGRRALSEEGIACAKLPAGGSWVSQVLGSLGWHSPIVMGL